MLNWELFFENTPLSLYCYFFSIFEKLRFQGILHMGFLVLWYILQNSLCCFPFVFIFNALFFGYPSILFSIGCISFLLLESFLCFYQVPHFEPSQNHIFWVDSYYLQVDFQVWYLGEEFLLNAGTLILNNQNKKQSST